MIVLFILALRITKTTARQEAGRRTENMGNMVFTDTAVCLATQRFYVQASWQVVARRQSPQ